ncbi:hypothetical protein NPIL_182641 [Nephila pilipes]|uniref:Uncharacterized protein n=1 Tax=Nephila pilipes TaxID=299642 RepID=A0A8X6UMY7_NEPPI|nr:hypothetical protein NPIL_182641 [Nephila pilipes]
MILKPFEFREASHTTGITYDNGEENFQHYNYIGQPSFKSVLKYKHNGPQSQQKNLSSLSGHKIESVITFQCAEESHRFQPPPKPQ